MITSLGLCHVKNKLRQPDTRAALQSTFDGFGDEYRAHAEVMGLFKLRMSELVK
jgi:hypothetical protein